MYAAIVNDTCLNIGRLKIRNSTIEKLNFLNFTLILNLSISNSSPLNVITGRFKNLTNYFNWVKYTLYALICGLLIGCPCADSH